MRAPSQPSPFSPEIQTFILTKYDPLLTIVRELNDRIEAAEKDRFRLERRIERLENHIKKLETGEGRGLPEERFGEEGIREDLKRLPDLAGNETNLTAPWLFSCQSGTPSASLQALLEFTPENTEELDARQWNAEQDLWIALLEDLPASIVVSRPESVSLHHLRACARFAILEMCRHEVLIIVRQVPGKDAVGAHRQCITFVAIIAAALSEGWARLEASDPNSLGRIALVLEGEGLGTRLRAGRNKFAIEPLN